MQNKFTYVAVLGGVFMLAPFAIDMYLPALPTIAAALGTGIDEVEATVAIYLLGFAVGQLILGPVSDAYGRRNVLIAGLGVYIVASVMAGLATQLETLYLWRFLQALGGAGSVGVFPLVRARFGEAGGAQVISYIMALTVVAPLLAPIIGGYVLAFAGWGAIFTLLGVLGALAILATLTMITDVPDRRPLSVSGVLTGYAAVLREPRILAAIAAGGFAFAGLFAFVAGSPFVYISYFGIAPENYGYLVALNAVAMIGANLINAQFLNDAEPVAKIMAGTIVLALAGVALVIIAALNLGLAPLVVAVVVFVGGLGFTATNAIVAALAVLPEENGTVAAINGAGQFSIGALSSFLVSLMASTSALPMTLIMCGCGLAALVSAVLLKRTTQSKGTSHA